MTSKDNTPNETHFALTPTVTDAQPPTPGSVFISLESLMQHEVDPGHFWWILKTGGGDLHVGDLYVKLDPGVVEHWYLFKNTGTYAGSSFGVWVTPSSSNTTVELKIVRKADNPKKLDGTVVTKGADWAAYLTAQGVQNTYITSEPVVVIP
jgi:hypothetical protein